VKHGMKEREQHVVDPPVSHSGVICGRAGKNASVRRGGGVRNDLISDLHVPPNVIVDNTKLWHREGAATMASSTARTRTCSGRRSKNPEPHCTTARGGALILGWARQMLFFDRLHFRHLTFTSSHVQQRRSHYP
jgi:hypothetical protein